MNKKEILTGLILAALVFLLGYISHRPPSQTIEQDKTKQTHKETTTVTTEDKCKKTTTTKIVEDTTTDTTKKKVEVTGPAIDYKKKLTSVNVLVTYDFQESKAIYGLQVTHEVLGPFTVGLFGLTNGTLGATVGMNF